jgi:threonine/homoserine efflux transporter RhtA
MRDTVRSGMARPGMAQSGIAQPGIALPAAMILTGIVSVQFGAGLADKLFGTIPPAAVTGLRLWTAALRARVRPLGP